MVAVMFYTGLVTVAINMVLMFTPGKLKPEAIAMPFMLFAGAAVGHYLGI